MSIERENSNGSSNEGDNEGVVVKDIDSVFDESMHEKWMHTVDDIQVTVSGRNFNFNAGWKKGETFLQLTFRNISIWKIVTPAALILLGWGAKVMWGH